MFDANKHKHTQAQVKVQKGKWMIGTLMSRISAHCRSISSLEVV